MIFEKIRGRLQKKWQSYMDEYGMIDIKIQEVFVEIRNLINQVEAEYKEEYKSKCADCTRRKFYMMGYQAAKQNNGWIPCSERLPEEAFGCLVTVMDYNPMTGNEFENILPYHVGFDGETWNDSDGKIIPFDVIAWQPLPQPPKGE